MDPEKTKTKSKSRHRKKTVKNRMVTVSATPAINAAVNARRNISVRRNSLINARRTAIASASSSSRSSSSRSSSAKSSSVKSSSVKRSSIVSKATPENDIICPRRKQRRGIIIPTVDLLSRAATGYKSNIKPLPMDTLKTRVETMETGPHYVNVTVPPATHTILVNITPKKIMISDWNGDIQTAGLKTDPDYDERWKQYSDFIQLLKEKYDLPVEYYDVDEALKTKAEEKAEAGGGGGCAEYAYEWAAKYLL